MQGIDRVIRSILSWEACETTARSLDYNQLMNYLAMRETARAEDLMREALEMQKRLLICYTKDNPLIVRIILPSKFLF